MHQVVLDSSFNLDACAVAVGAFDGVHLGHVDVLGHVVGQARNHGFPSVAVTFDPHPLRLIAPERAPRTLTGLHEKAWRMDSLGVDVLGVIPFTQEIRGLEPEAFVERYLVGRLHARVVVVGHDHGFGRDRRGGLESMRALGQRLGFQVVSVHPTIKDDGPVSSTRIRTAVEAGDFEAARSLIGAGYPVAGRVVPGDGRGRELGFPTANIQADEPDKLMPPDGVYAAWAHLPERHPAVVNLGGRPTFNGRSRTLEAHLIDFSGDLYDTQMIIEFEHRLRGQRRFDGPESLIDQISKDCRATVALLSSQDSTLLRR